MALFSRAASIADDDEQFDRSGLLRISAWGLAAVIAVTVAVLAGRTEIGWRRVGAAVAAMTASPADTPQATLRQLLARTADTEREARRLAELVRTLTSERERLAVRLGMVEREVGDVTASIGRGTPAGTPDRPAPVEARPLAAPAVTVPLANLALGTPAPATTDSRGVAGRSPLGAAPAADQVPAEAAPDASNAASFIPLPMPRPSGQIERETQVAARNAPADPPMPAAALETAPAAAAPTATTSVPAAASAKAEADDPQPRVEIGVDLGPAFSMSKLRARWSAFRATYGSATDALRPIVTVREMGQGKPLELRLVVGPLPDVNAASRLCATLAGSQFVCQPAVFEGQRLALR
jgi:hypothetical protein